MPADRLPYHTTMYTEGSERTLVDRDILTTFSTRFDPISKRTLFKCRTESQLPDITMDSRQSLLQESLSHERNVFARRHELIAREYEMRRTKLKIVNSLQLAEKEAKENMSNEKKLTAEEMREKDRQALLKITFTTYEQKWSALVYPEEIMLQQPDVGQSQDNEDDTDTASVLEDDDVEPHLLFIDVPWPLFSVARSLPDFLENLNEVSTFLHHPELHKYFEGVNHDAVWRLQKLIWNPSKFNYRVLRKVVEEDREQVYKAYLKVREVLWEGKIEI